LADGDRGGPISTHRVVKALFSLAFAAMAAAPSVLASSAASGSGRAARSNLTTARDPLAVSINNAMQSLVVDVTGPESIIVENQSGIYASINAGDRWTRIFDADAVTLTHIVGIVSVGTNDIWLREIGDFRYDFVPYSRDGGRSWKTSTLPGGANNPSSIAFANSNDGTLIADEATSNGGGLARLVTTNGGQTWVRTSLTATRISAPEPALLSPVADGKVPKGLRIQHTYYASTGLSWAQASDTSGSTFLLRSGDDGRQWAYVPEVGVYPRGA
jgi:photosystem II stability/assembly factor-like uncharacterized protein